MPAVVHLKNGATIVVNSIPENFKIAKKPKSGVLSCDRCGREAANAVRDEGVWELWWLMQRSNDLCPDCVTKVVEIAGESRRIPNPQYWSRMK